MPIKLNGATSGSVELDVPAAVSGGDVTLTLPPDDGSAGQVLSTNGAGALSFVNNVEWDQFQLSLDQTSDGIITNWARCSYRGFGQVGGQMAVSNGIFTFPSTGHYLIISKVTFNLLGSDTAVLSTHTTIDNGSYAITGYVSDGGNNGTTQTRHGGSAAFTFIDVTDTNYVKVKFSASSIGTGSKLIGDSGATPYTTITFVRLGDT